MGRRSRQFDRSIFIFVYFSLCFYCIQLPTIRCETPTNEILQLYRSAEELLSPPLYLFQHPSVDSLASASTPSPSSTSGKYTTLKESDSAPESPVLHFHCEKVYGDPNEGDCVPVWEVAVERRSSPSVLRVLIIAGEHGRELVTSEIIEAFSRRLLHYSDDKLRSQLQDIVEKSEFRIVPLVNAYGRKRVEDGEFCSRKNKNGVDLNRNYGFEWVNAGDPMREDYGGVMPFSEPETKFLNKISVFFRPNVYINLHSGEYAVYYPYDYADRLPENEQLLRSPIADALFDSVSSCLRHACRIGSGAATSGYTAPGSSMDFFYERGGVPFSYTLEVFGNHEMETAGDCLRIFNPDDKDEVSTLSFEWSTAIIRLLAKLIDAGEKDHIFEVLQYHEEHTMPEIRPPEPPSVQAATGISRFGVLSLLFLAVSGWVLVLRTIQQMQRGRQSVWREDLIV